MRRFIIASIVVSLLGTLPSVAQIGSQGSCDLDSWLEELPTQKLRKKEKRNLLFMREEEKLARDVYLSLYEEWGFRAFRQIASAESSHMASALVLIEKYELLDPVGDNALGVFTNRGLQALYEDLSATGSNSLESALRVGAAIEELDLSDLKRAYEKSNNQDLRVLYQNLMKGSRNHLRAYAGLLERYGEAYEPAYLGREEFEAIVESAREKGLVGVDGEPVC